MTRSRKIFGAVLIAVVTVSCVRDPKQPGREYMPDMAHSVAYDAGSPNPLYASGATNQLPPVGSIAVGKYTYPLSNTPEGYEKAATSITNPFTFSDDEIKKEGKKLFTIYCIVCHGEAGDGQGHLVQIDKYPAPPSYFTPDLLSKPDGQRYHTIMYGKGMMGSYATQLEHRERWLVLEYVRLLQNDYLAKEKGSAATN
jgi:mono/diheme cytochrome c family protein